ncbi:MAG TPA: FAD-dependent oxidoreductase [Syntrophales bacterium]|nr:FAD-dependent oxidoreductase [Syntrophales bacterium]HOM06236.1 FAD-dependent oxidoreductase [Syntrophales bacterium]HPC00149.1 FAD-dependent oxidoreductase [Syntrophales bacterium]HPQ05782.1 FAD-dependent oxidoreductase [Syntrophales bacterium]
MPYYIGDVIKDYNKLVIRTPEAFGKTGIKVLTKTRVEEIDAARGEVRLADGSRLPYDSLTIATGARATRLDIPGVDLDGVFVLRDLSDALRIKDYLNGRACRRAVIVGGGFIAMEMSEALRNLGIETTVIVRRHRPVPRWDEEFCAPILEELEKNGVLFQGGTTPLSIERNGEGLVVKTNSGDLGADLVLMAVGVRSNTELAAAAGVEMGESGAIKVDFRQQTSVPGIYAVGDCCEVFHKVARRWVYIPLGDIANKQGRVAGQNIGGRPAEFPGVVGAQSFKVFDLEVAAAGLNENEAVKYGFAPASAFIQGLPVGRPIARGERLLVKLTADKTTGRLIGAQCLGAKGAVQRIFALSAALWNGMTVDEVGYLDLPYAPPFGGAWDAIHVAAQELARSL